MKLISWILAITILFSTIPASLAQTSTQNSANTPAAPMAFGLTDGTPVKLRLGRTMSSADAKTGETVDFEVLEDIKIGDALIIARGSTALGTVTEAKPRGRMGKGGKLDIVIDSVRLVSGEKIALRASKQTSGAGHVGAMTGAIVATSIVFFPAAPFFLFMKGKDITIPKGTEITAYTNGDIALDPAKFVASGASPITTIDQKTATANSDKATIMVKSTPDGAEIDVDGHFVGSSPSTIQVSPGERKITLKKQGFVSWERTILIGAGGSVNLDATLDKIP